MRKPTPTETVSTGASVVTAYAALVLTQKYGIPTEVAAAAVGILATVGSRLVQFISDSPPEKRPKKARA